jgi:hypothetical protein
MPNYSESLKAKSLSNSILVAKIAGLGWHTSYKRNMLNTSTDKVFLLQPFSLLSCEGQLRIGDGIH